MAHCLRYCTTDLCLRVGRPGWVGHCSFGDWRLEQGNKCFIERHCLLLVWHIATFHSWNTSVEQWWNDTDVVEHPLSNPLSWRSWRSRQSPPFGLCSHVAVKSLWSRGRCSELTSVPAFDAINHSGQSLVVFGRQRSKCLNAVFIV
jgi:hypothetical protein